MDSKQIWVTVFVALIVAVLSSILINFFAEKQVRASPGIDPTERPFPDLIIDSISYVIIGQDNPDGGTVIDITTKVKNIGNFKAENSYTWLHPGSFNKTCASIAYPAGTPPLAPEQTKTFRVTIVTDFKKCGPIEFIAVADIYDQVAESNEHNNARNITIKP